jgi:protocatechuate 3,4-dioxygenase, alpha subunit
VKFIPTGSQTVGPFFSLGLAPLCQQALSRASAPAGTITLEGTIFDGEQTPIPDAVFEFWSNAEFVRVASNEDGSFSVLLKRPPDTQHFDVLIFMRGLMRPVLTRLYFGEATALSSETSLQQVPSERRATLLARTSKTIREFLWNVHMQGEHETVFFDF